jgi:hypothetical protein
MRQVFIADGRLYVRDQAGEIQELESQFVLEKLNRSERRNATGGWKGRSTSEDPNWQAGIVWGGQSAPKMTMPFRFSHLVVADENRIYYTLANPQVTGLFEYDFKDQFETRLFHKNDFQENGFDYSAVRKEFVMSVWAEDRSSYLKLLDSNGSGIKSLTSGDTTVSNPSFGRYHPDDIFFQSAQIVRSEEGFFMMSGPGGIFRLNPEDNEASEVLFDERYDFLLPKEDSQGNLYCIRRPYTQSGHRSIWRIILDTLLFPIHFVGAIVGFLEAFTRLFNQQAFKASGPEVQIPPQDKYVKVLGQTIRMAQVRRSTRFGQEPSLVPASWELIRIAADGKQEVLAGHVASYDMDQDGHVIYTNGYKVHHIHSGEQNSEFKFNLIQTICACRK